MRISTSDLLLAYRQAKASLFFEKRGVGLIDIAQYEANLENNLLKLQNKLLVGDGWFAGINPGRVLAVPKRQRSDANNSPATNYITRVEDIPRTQEASGLDIQFRLSPAPEFAIIEILYLWKFGPLLDSLLPAEAVGYRLSLRNGIISKTNRWVFEYWPDRYNEFRKDWLKVAQLALLDRDSSVDVLTTDLASFYDTVDANFLLSQTFIDEIERKAKTNDEPFSQDEYICATRSLLSVYRIYQLSVEKKSGVNFTIGVPIGALTSRLIANVSLATLDKCIINHPDVKCYRRYVDDIVVVGQSDSVVEDTVDSMIRHYLEPCREAADSFHLDVDMLERPGSTFKTQKEKCRAYRLQGESGLDFLSSVNADFTHLISERRAFIDPTVFNERKAKNIIRAGKEVGSKVRSLRDADRIKLEHLALSTALSSLERISRMVDPKSAKKVIRNALEGLDRHVSDHGNWVEYLDSALRLLKISVRVEDWASVNIIIRKADALWSDIDRLKDSCSALYYHGIKIDRESAWVSLRNYLHELRLEAICSSIGMHSGPKIRSEIHRTGVLYNNRRLRLKGLLSRARTLSHADLRTLDREEDFGILQPHKDSKDLESEQIELGVELQERLNRIKLFIKRIQKLNDSSWDVGPLRLFLSTRPPSYFDIARRWLYNVESHGFKAETFDDLLEVVNAIRGTNYLHPVGSVSESASNQVVIPHQPFSKKEHLDVRVDPRLMLGNLVTSDDEFAASISGRPCVTSERLNRIVDIISKAQASTRYRQKGMLVLPELSLPRKWLREIANYVVQDRSFGLVVGLEYWHDQSRKIVYNQVVAILPGPYSSVATWPWTKRNPADIEAKELDRKSLQFATPRLPDIPRTVVDSYYGKFSVLICSELLESSRVNDLLGRAELILVPSWNKDTASYDHLIQSVGFQLHAIIGIANNGHYSDCRAWAPIQTRWKRDLCRLIERDQNDIVHVDIPLISLREFHSKARVFDQNINEDTVWRPCPPDWPLNSNITK